MNKHVETCRNNLSPSRNMCDQTPNPNQNPNCKSYSAFKCCPRVHTFSGTVKQTLKSKSVCASGGPTTPGGEPICLLLKTRDTYVRVLVRPCCSPLVKLATKTTTSCKGSHPPRYPKSGAPSLSPRKLYFGMSVKLHTGLKFELETLQGFRVGCVGSSCN